jgi:hypothetical protein
MTIEKGRDYYRCHAVEERHPGNIVNTGFALNNLKVTVGALRPLRSGMTKK